MLSSRAAKITLRNESTLRQLLFLFIRKTLLFWNKLDEKAYHKLKLQTLKLKSFCILVFQINNQQNMTFRVNNIALIMMVLDLIKWNRDTGVNEQNISIVIRGKYLLVRICHVRNNFYQTLKHLNITNCMHSQVSSAELRSICFNGQSLKKRFTFLNPKKSVSCHTVFQYALSVILCLENSG